MELDRRQFLAGLGASLGAASIGCGDHGLGAAPDAAALPPVDGEAACPTADAAAARATLADIDTIVVLCLENRSFDHTLGALRLAERRADIDGLTGAEWNPDNDGYPQSIYHIAETLFADPPHNWDASHRQWHDGANDGFVQAHSGPYQTDVMGYRLREQVPVTFALADQGAVCNRWFSSCLGPTWPNRAFLHAGTSTGMKEDLPMLYPPPLIWDRLAAAHLGGTNYYHDVPWALAAFGKTEGFAPIERFFTDALAGRLPPLAMIDPGYFGALANDDHPTHTGPLAQALIASVVAALAASPQWARCLFVLTYDEHGGFYDHVAPPPIAAPLEPYADFRQLGFRVPSIVIGPHVRRGCAVDAVLEHCAVPATVCRRFGLGSLNARVDAATDLSVCLDPRRRGAPLPPPTLPRVMLDRAALAGRPSASHADMAAAVATRAAPAGLDRRGDADAIARRVLRWGEQLDVVRVG